MFMLLYSAGVHAQENSFKKLTDTDSLPVPKEKHQLFYLQRDPDANTIVYQLNMVKHALDKKNPINVYWIRYAEQGQQQKLTFVQRNMAYGLKHKLLDNGDYELRLVAYQAFPLLLSYSEKHKRYVVYASINNRQVMLDRIFVRITGGNIFNPNIDYFELIGRDEMTGEVLREKIKP